MLHLEKCTVKQIRLWELSQSENQTQFKKNNYFGLKYTSTWLQFKTLLKNKTNQSGWRYNTQNKHRKRFWVSYWELKPLTYFRLPSLVVLGSWRIPSSSTRSHDSENNVKNTKHCKLLKKIKVQNIEIQFRNVWQ